MLVSSQALADADLGVLPSVVTVWCLLHTSSVLVLISSYHPANAYHIFGAMMPQLKQEAYLMTSKHQLCVLIIPSCFFHGGLFKIIYT